MEADAHAVAEKTRIAVDMDATTGPEQQQYTSSRGSLRPINDGHLQQLDRIGGGNYGDVYKGLLNEREINDVPQYKVAIKIAKPDASGSDTNEAALRQEAELMAKFKHDNIVAVIGVVTHLKHTKIVLQFCENGSLQSMLRERGLNQNQAQIPEEAALKVAADITAGMAFLESHDFVHRDLACRNILVDLTNTCLVADFGMSRELPTEYYTIREDTALPVRWSAPEVVLDKKHTTASDVWSFFVLMWEVWSAAAQPFEKFTNHEVSAKLHHVANNDLEPHTLLPKPDAVTTDLFQEFQNRCFCADPKTRETFVQLNSWVNGLLGLLDTAATPELALLDDDSSTSDYYVQILKEQSRGYPLFDELQRAHVGMISITASSQEHSDGALSDNCYTSAAYDRLSQVDQQIKTREQEIVGGSDTLKLTSTLKDATEELHRHSTKYCELFDTWRTSTWPGRLRTAHKALMEWFDVGEVLQPNPWQSKDIKATSKRYLDRIIEVFSDPTTSNPVHIVSTACTEALAEIGEKVELKTGSPKKEKRILEKAQADSKYDAIRDYGRMTLIVKDMEYMPNVVKRLSSCPYVFKLIRAKNRLDLDHDAYESAGYRDYQLLARVVKTGWVVEIQVIPAEMFRIKDEFGHKGYAKYRFILEACKRAKAKASKPRDALPKGANAMTENAVRKTSDEEKANNADAPVIRNAEQDDGMLDQTKDAGMNNTDLATNPWAEDGARRSSEELTDKSAGEEDNTAKELEEVEYVCVAGGGQAALVMIRQTPDMQDHFESKRGIESGHVIKTKYPLVSVGRGLAAIRWIKVDILPAAQEGTIYHRVSGARGKLVNVRTGPGFNFSAVGQLHDNQLVNVVETHSSGDWLRIIYDGRDDRWVVSQSTDGAVSLSPEGSPVSSVKQVHEFDWLPLERAGAGGGMMAMFTQVTGLGQAVTLKDSRHLDWIADSASKACMQCGGKFGLLNRR